MSNKSYRLATRESFLHGNVRDRLSRLKQAAALDPIFEAGVAALESVQPDPIDISDITINPGALWIPTSDYEQFCLQVLHVSVKILRTEVTGMWEIDLQGTNSPTNRQTYGITWTDVTYAGNDSPHYLFGTDLLQMLMNGKTPQIRIRQFEGERTIKSPVLTASACQKQAELKAAFQEWCRSDDNRVKRLEYLYNYSCNNLRLRKYDGSVLSLSQMSPDWADRVRQRPYQLNGIYRGLIGQDLTQRSNLGVFWEVGLGKTVCGTAIAAERILNQTATRALFVVKKQTLGDFARTVRGAYPQLNVLVASQRDLSKDKRGLFLARAVYNAPDIIIMTHEQFASIPVQVATMRRYINDQITQINQDINASTQSGMSEGTKAVKQLERIRSKLLEKIQELSVKHDEGICFEQLGIDLLLVDEAHCYKNDYFFTKMDRVAGLTQTQSRRSADFRLKKWWFEGQHGVGNLILMTGTFISNSVAEAWRVMMDLCPDEMRLRGWHLFDSWAASCAEVKTSAAIKNTGAIEQERRLSEFVNLTELLTLLHGTADIQTADSVGIELNRPDAKYVNVVAPMSDDQREFMDDLVRRTQLIKNKTPQSFFRMKSGQYVLDKEGNREMIDDNALFVTTDGRKSVVDYRLVDPEATDFYKSKLNMCVRRAAKIWQKTRELRATQIIFCDLGVNPSGQFWLYDDLREKLIAAGVDRDEIAIAQEWNTDSQREKLHEFIRTGRKRVIIASTDILGVGANVQDRLIALHHCDVKWRPLDMIQREGRIVRPGNMFKRVLIYRYITQGRDGNVGFDSFMWDKIRNKTKFIQQLFSRNFNLRRFEEDASEDPTFSTAEIVALATGDHRIMAYVELEAQIQLNNTLLAGFEREIDQIRFSRLDSRNDFCIPRLERAIKDEEAVVRNSLPDIELARANLDSWSGENFKVIIQGEEFIKSRPANDRLWEIAEVMKEQLVERGGYWAMMPVGEFAGFELAIRLDKISGDDFETRFILRNKSNDQGKNYRRNLLKNGYRLEEQLTEEVKDILKQHRHSIKIIDDCKQAIEQCHQRAEELDRKIKALRAIVVQQSLDKQALEEELGLNKQEDATESIDFGED